MRRYRGATRRAPCHSRAAVSGSWHSPNEPAACHSMQASWSVRALEHCARAALSRWPEPRRAGRSRAIRRATPFQLGDTLANEFDDIIALLAWDDALRVVSNDSTVCPYQIVAKLGAVGQESIQILVNWVGVVGRGDLFLQANKRAIEIGSAMDPIDNGPDLHG